MQATPKRLAIIAFSAALVAMAGIACVSSPKSTGSSKTASSTKGPKRGLADAETHAPVHDLEYADLTDQQAVGREIWYKATGGSSRYHSYTFNQRVMGKNILWYKFLRTDDRDHRFDNWGLIQDPDCCAPGDANCCATIESKRDAVSGDAAACAQMTPEKTFGFDYCPGDLNVYRYLPGSDKAQFTEEQLREQLLDPQSNPFHKNPYVLAQLDPACKLDRQFKGASTSELDKQGYGWIPKFSSGTPQSSCDLEFGTSTGALGFRKFPNPRFDLKKWNTPVMTEVHNTDGKIIGKDKLSGWALYNARPDDHSIEPPFMVGVSCGSCHIGFNPANPPADANHPKWENIRGTVGEQYVKSAVLMGSGLTHDTLEWQDFSHERPGTTDTSAVPNDTIYDPGSMNAIINLPQRRNNHRAKDGSELVMRYWYRESCDASDLDNCWKDPDNGSWWHRRNANMDNLIEAPYFVLKDGADSSGPRGAVQRVHINIGVCAEQCWLNHLPDQRALDPNQRNYGQSPFDLAQCRRDCPNWRALEDHTDAELSFLQAARETRLQDAMEADQQAQAKLQQKLSSLGLYDSDAHDRGRAIYAHNCAQCHSSQSIQGVFDKDPASLDHYITESQMNYAKLADPTHASNAKTSNYAMREDWLGNDERTPILSDKGPLSHVCRSLGTNAMEGHVWAQFSSESYKHSDKVPGLEKYTGNGPGYLRNPSLVNVWAFAPLLSNNGMGQEYCYPSQLRDPATANYTVNGQSLAEYQKEMSTISPYIDEKALGKGGWEKKSCKTMPVSVNDRVDGFLAGINDLLSPIDARHLKKSITDQPVHLPLIPAISLVPGQKMKGTTLEIPAGVPVAKLGSFDHKAFVADFLGYLTNPNWPDADALKRLGATTANKLKADFAQTKAEFLSHKKSVLTVDLKRMLYYFDVYGNCPSGPNDSYIIENTGHFFGIVNDENNQPISDDDTAKRAKHDLIAFLLSL